MPYLDSLDIANRALQHVSQTQIVSVTEDSKNNLETSFAYDKVRQAELRRNAWRFAIRKTVLRAVDTGTMVLEPDLWSSATVYLPGAIVSDANGLTWISLIEENLNNQPGGNNEAWDSYFGPMTVVPWDSGTSYYAGEVVYKAGALPSQYHVYMSLKNGNTDVPDVAAAWDSATLYYGNDVVSYGGSQWRSLVDLNQNITPADGPLSWDSGATYSASQQVTGSDQFIYTSVGNGNIGHDPTTDGGIHWTNTNVPNAWSRTPTITPSSPNWRPIQADMSLLRFPYPIGSGPASDSGTRNVFRLPAGYLKVAPQDPKAGSVSLLGAPSGLPYDDWTYEGDYLVSGDTGPIVFRFVADVTRVRSMDPMFCEGLALTLAIAICPTITQSHVQLSDLASEYKMRMTEARTANLIEAGPEEPPLDDFITCRM